VACEHTIKAEYSMFMTTVRAYKGAHVLYHAKDRYIDFAEEINTSHYISQR
jgi:hypothetical protein